MNFELKEKLQLGVFEISNFELLKTELNNFLANMTVSDDEKENKQIRAKLNSFKKAISDRRIEIKNEYLKPFEVGENQAKELEKLIQDANDKFDKVVKEAEEKQKEEKRLEILNIWESKKYIKVSLEQVFDKKWLNKTTSLKKVEEEIDSAINSIENDLNSIKMLVKENEKVNILQSKYLINLDLNKTIGDYNQELERLEMLKKQQEQVIEEKTVINNQEDVRERVAEEKHYTLSFQVIATRIEIETLSRFLKENNYNYKKI